MKKPIVIIFIVILAIHLLALTLFLIYQKDDGAVKEPDKKEIIPEPEIDTGYMREKTESAIFSRRNPRETDSSIKESGNKILPPTKSSGFYAQRKFPVFAFKESVNGNISDIPLTKEAKAGILVDLDSGKVLWEKNAKIPVPIASMTKMMTVLIACESIRGGKIDYNKNIKVSKKAASVGGSDIWLDPRETFPLKVLLKAMIIKSANDAAELIGETLGDGDIKVFVKKMNARASDLGLKNAKFYNPHGLPGKNASEDNVASCEELAKLAALLLQYPEVIKMSSTKVDYIERKVGKHKKTMLTSTNHLVRKGVKGVDGLKTGYTERAGCCLTATCKRDNRRLVAVVTGFNRSADRDECVKQLLDWGYDR